QVDLLSLSTAADKEFVRANKKDAVHNLYAPDSCWYRLAFNTTRKPLDDVRVRRALALVVDHKRIGENLVGSWDGKALWKYPGPLPWVFPEALPQEELAKLQLFQGPTPQNVAEARQLLKDAGYEQGFGVELITSRTSLDEVQLFQDDIER